MSACNSVGDARAAYSQEGVHGVRETVMESCVHEIARGGVLPTGLVQELDQLKGALAGRGAAATAAGRRASRVTTAGVWRRRHGEHARCSGCA